MCFQNSDSYIYNLNFYHFLTFTVGKPEVIANWLFSKQRTHELTIVFLWFFLLLLSFSLLFLFLLSFFFVAVILELLMLKKPAFWCLFTQITANFVTLVFKKLVRCISPLLPQFQVWPLKLKLFCLQLIDSERKPKEHVIDHRQSGMWKT